MDQNEPASPGGQDGQPVAPRTCEKCGAAMELLQRFPKALGEAAREVFQCLECQALEWVRDGN
jgi:hypothetical protein